MLRRIISALLFLPTLFLIAAEPPVPPPAPPPNPVPIEARVFEFCNAHVDGYSAFDRLFQRYIWIEDAVYENAQAVSLACNYLNQTPTIKRPEILTSKVDPDIMVSHIDLRWYAGRDPKILNKMVKDWESFQFDPKFNLLITRGTIKFLDIPLPAVKKTVTEKVKVNVKPYKWTDGKEYDWKWETVNKIVEEPFNIGDHDVVRFPSQHINVGLYDELVDKTRSQAPIVSHRYFVNRALSSIDNDNATNKVAARVYKTIWGGIYYELAQVPVAGKDGTDLDAAFESVGIGNAKAKINFEQIFDVTRSDKAGIHNRSNVTGKRRRWRIFPTLAYIGGIFSLAEDLEDAEVDIDTDFLFNLLKTAGKPVHEGIWEIPCGLHKFGLWNGDGKLVREAPFNVANDTTIPSPHTLRLESGISCIRCHARDKGWRLLQNDIRGIVEKKFDVFSDRSNRKKENEDQIERIVGLYSGDVESEILPTARNRYAQAVLKATGSWKESKNAQTDVVELSAAQLGKIVDYKYQMVDATKALQDLRIPFRKGTELETLERILPPVLNAQVDGVVQEDIRLAMLKEGKSISQYDWDLFYSFAASRAIRKGKQ